MATLIEPALAVLEGSEHEQIRALVKPRLAQPNSVHDPIAKRQLGHRFPPVSSPIEKRRDHLRPADEKKMTAVRRHHNSPAIRLRQRTAEENARLGRVRPKIGGLCPSLRAVWSRRDRLLSLPTRMPRAFKYDVAITAADFDALAVAEITRRLDQRLTKGVFSAPRPSDQARTAAGMAAVRKPIEKDARVVVVLFQRLWGAT